MSNILIVPDSGSIYFTTGSAGSSAIPNLSSGVAFKFDNSAGVNITSYATGVSDNDRFSIDGYNGRLFNVSDNLTGIIFSVNDGAGLPIIEVDSGAVDKVTMGTYGTNTFVIDGNKVGIGTGVPAAKLDIFDNVLAGSAGLAGSVLNLNQTWNTTGTPSAIKLNVTDTASNGASNLINLQLNGFTRLNLTKAGSLTVSDSDSGNRASSIRIVQSDRSVNLIPSAFGGNAGGLGGPNFYQTNCLNGSIAFDAINSNGTISFFRLFNDNVSDTLAQRNGASPQAFRLYNTYTDATTFERLNIKWDTNILKIGTEKGSAGGVARAMELQTDGTTRMTIADAGNIGIGTIAPGNKLHVQGAANGEGLRVSHSAGVGTRLDIIAGDGSQVAVGNAVFTIDGTSKLILNPSGLILPASLIRVASNPQTLYIHGGYSAGTLGNSLILGSNTINGGPFTATSGTQNIVSIGVSSNESWNPASGNAAYNLLRIAPVINSSGTYAGIVRGLYVNPTLTSVIGTDFRALDLSNTSGFGIYQSGASANNYFAGNIGIGTATPTEKLHVLGNIRNVGNLSISNSDIATTLDRLTVDGSQGRLFTVTDSLVGSLMSVNDIAGLPILEVFDDDKIVMGEYASNALTVLGKNVGIGTGSPTAKLDILDTVLAGSGSLAGSALNISQTWNTSGTPTAIKLNVTDTTSNAASNLMDLQLGGLNRFTVRKNGVTTISSIDGGGGDPMLFLKNQYGTIGITVGGGARLGFSYNGPEFLYYSQGGGLFVLGFLNLGIGVYLHRDGADNILAQRNGVNPQASRLYNTYTSSTNFERLNLRWDTNVVKIGTEKGSAGGVARDLSFETDATTRMTIAATGDISFSNPTQVRTALGFVQLTPAEYAALVNAGTTNPDTIYIVQE